jgi:hypothetical protein
MCYCYFHSNSTQPKGEGGFVRRYVWGDRILNMYQEPQQSTSAQREIPKPLLPIQDGLRILRQHSSSLAEIKELFQA